MSIIVLLAYWYTYSKWYILGSWFITYILNIAFKKLWLSPLLINALALGVLFIGIYYKLIEGWVLSVNPELRVNRHHLSTGGGGGESAHPVSLKTD